MHGLNECTAQRPVEPLESNSQNLPRKLLPMTVFSPQPITISGTHNILLLPPLVVRPQPRDDLQEDDAKAVDVDGRAQVAARSL